ncbi:hypothetical protein OU995_11695 [Roseateles sp. SL47]|uniref:hypothetical protein n=1 Tax=Roseateles sp. SL47 TaxID=2995138 RepID=UPI00226EF455|nr:hypothetical protein [Roseateles sp. SL47]WAC75311.1 hypothetical protein OU995_11695 [Roseateles sp. SL47]
MTTNTEAILALDSIEQYSGAFVMSKHKQLATIRAYLASAPAQPRIFLVATGEEHEGEATYTRHEGSPPPLCDFEGPLYASAPAQPKAMTDLLEEARDTIAKLLIKIRRDAPDLAGKLLGYADQVVARVDAALDSPRAAQAAPRINQCGETCERAKLCATCAGKIDAPSPEAKAQAQAVPVAYMSPKQIHRLNDPIDGSGVYIPLRLTPAGRFTMALYAAPQPPAPSEQRKPAADIDEAHLKRMTDEGAKAWAGVDAQSLRDGGEERCVAVAADQTSTDLALWKAMNAAEKVGNRSDDKLIRKALNEAGYQLVRHCGIALENGQRLGALPTLGIAPSEHPATDIDEAQIQRMTEEGAKAWAGVDAQALRDGGEQRKPLTDEEVNTGLDAEFGDRFRWDQVQNSMRRAYRAGYAHGIRSTGGA